ncbi:multifunctional CCA tRNA nucleotidyl transferase/2'3'-cyclic phosphodiesterase/2'nucleotidase/phosphatase [Entomomonas sp. E2T0]|nr:multifunctional CCA tRNA nucleotidyl transferase/2'3'-cyclic phosphodiesterase/2'nucleotidase/phosphatase [Entomomonas sp. E2T0]
MDTDWVVVGATAEDMLAQGYQPVGADFPVFLHPKTGEEYALARTERKSGKGYGGFTFFTDPAVTLEQDLARRDLTINAIAEDESGNLYDPYHGQQDIDNRVLRHVSAAFVEDPLRVLRVARFAARYASLGFTIADETLALMTILSASGELDELTAERVWKEFSRALMEPSPEVFLQVLQRCKALSVLLPELLDLPLVERVLKQAAIEQQPLVVRWACLMIPLALAGKINSIKAINERFKVPNDCSDLALLTGQYLVICQQSLTQSTDELLNLLQRTDILRRPERLLLLLQVCVLLAKVTGQLDYKAEYLPGLFLNEIAEAVRAVKPQPLIAKGLQGAALGKALTQQRLAVIAQIKEDYL